MQAGIAINNAELHSRLGQQQQLLKAVLRDINDGLVVVDSRAQIVLTNPLGAALLSLLLHPGIDPEQDGILRVLRQQRFRFCLGVLPVVLIGQFEDFFDLAVVRLAKLRRLGGLGRWALTGSHRQQKQRCRRSRRHWGGQPGSCKHGNNVDEELVY